MPLRLSPTLHTIVCPKPQNNSEMLPETTRKNLSHYRAQLKRQALKATRLDRRSSTVDKSSPSNSKLNETQDIEDEKATAMFKNSPVSKNDKQNCDLPKFYSDNNKLNSKKKRNSVPKSGQDCINDTNNSLSYCDSSAKPLSSLVRDFSIDSPNDKSKKLGKADDNSASKGQEDVNVGGGHSVFGRHYKMHLNPSSVHPKNVKRKFVTLMRKIRSKSEFVNEEQYRKALERELLKAAACKSSSGYQDFLEDGDCEGQANTNSESDWDSISGTSTPKPSLIPFFSTTTLDKI